MRQLLTFLSNDRFLRLPRLKGSASLRDSSSGLVRKKCNAYSRPHFDGICSVCASDNPIKVRAMHFTYLARQLPPGLPAASNCFGDVVGTSTLGTSTRNYNRQRGYLDPGRLDPTPLTIGTSPWN